MILINIKDTLIYKKVKDPGPIPLEKLNKFLGASVYFDKASNKWYGGDVEDQWMIIQKLLIDGNLKEENIEKFL